jgi:hypothetical protein
MNKLCALEQDDQTCCAVSGESVLTLKSLERYEHFGHKLELFGISKVANSRITLPELSEDDTVSLRVAFLQDLGLDQLGRCVSCL